jgi:Rha family phage regulatory protein
MKTKFIDELQLKEMVTTQLLSWELTLKQKGLSQATIDRKIRNIGLFYHYMTIERLNSKDKKLKVDRMSSLAFELVRDGFFSEDNIENEGTYGYRQNIYSNIRSGINYVYEDYFQDRTEVIKELTLEQKEILNDVSKNKWFKVNGIHKTEESVNENIQVQLIKQLGIKVYFDNDNKPYVLTHELADIIGKTNKDIMRAIRNLLKEINERNFAPVAKATDFNMFEDIYKDSKGEERPTLRLHKDLLFMYILGLTGKQIVEFKMKYIDAFNYIEEEYNKLLIENAQLKESFLNMYNEVRKRNRDLLVVEHNKKCVKKKAS